MCHAYGHTAHSRSHYGTCTSLLSTFLVFPFAFGQAPQHITGHGFLSNPSTRMSHMSHLQSHSRLTVTLQYLHPSAQFTPSVLSQAHCYVEFLPEHSPMFSDVLCTHVTPSHPFHPTCPFKILMSSSFRSLSATFLHQHHIHHINHGCNMPGLSWNHLGIFQAVTEHHQKHHGYT